MNLLPGTLYAGSRMLRPSFRWRFPKLLVQPAVALYHLCSIELCSSAKPSERRFSGLQSCSKFAEPGIALILINRTFAQECLVRIMPSCDSLRVRCWSPPKLSPPHPRSADFRKKSLHGISSVSLPVTASSYQMSKQSVSTYTGRLAQGFACVLPPSC